jgi:hypothetical protein
MTISWVEAIEGVTSPTDARTFFLQAARQAGVAA